MTTIISAIAIVISLWAVGHVLISDWQWHRSVSRMAETQRDNQRQAGRTVREAENPHIS